MRILIADDENISRTVLSRTLQPWDHEVVAPADGTSRWTLMREKPPAMVILDWMMPGLDGPTLCRRIRQDPALVHMYVLLLSARDSRHDLVAGLNAGADDYLTKPFDPDELRARVNVGQR